MEFVVIKTGHQLVQFKGRSEHVKRYNAIHYFVSYSEQEQGRYTAGPKISKWVM